MIATWKPDRLLQTLLLWTTLLMSVEVWVPLVRSSIEGTAYPWAFSSGIGGRGTGGDYWMLVAGTLFSGAVLYLGWRGARQPFHWLALALHGAFAAVVLYAAMTVPEQLFFDGATLGVRFSFATAGPVFFAGVFAGLLFWVIRDLRHHERRAAPPWVWTRNNGIRLLLIVVIVPLQVVLLRSAGPMGPAAAVGVLLTLWQWFMLTHGLLRPVSPSA